jgi:hypothetical protein
MSPTQKNLLLVASVSVVVIPGAFFLYLWTAPRVDRPAPAFICSQNLRQIDAAKQMWVIEHESSTNRFPSWEDIHPYIGRSVSDPLPTCPQGGTYTIGRIGEIPSCSISEHTAAFRESTRDKTQ